MPATFANSPRYGNNARATGHDKNPIMAMSPRKTWVPLTILALALVVWAGIFAAGAYLEPSADLPRRDLRKPLIIFATMATFLGLWGLALWLRSRRKTP